MEEEQEFDIADGFFALVLSFALLAYQFYSKEGILFILGFYSASAATAFVAATILWYFTRPWYLHMWINYISGITLIFIVGQMVMPGLLAKIQ